MARHQRAALIGFGVGALCGVAAIPFEGSESVGPFLLLAAWCLADIVGLSALDWAFGVAAILYFGALGGVAGRLFVAARSKLAVGGVFLLVAAAHIGATMIAVHRFGPLNFEDPFPPEAFTNILRESPSPQP